MSEVAEDIIDGSCCSECGMYFRNNHDKDVYTHGYPVLCISCWNKQQHKERIRKVNSIGLQRALRNTY